MTPPGIPAPIAEPRDQRMPGRCRVCGCTDAEGCGVLWDLVYTDSAEPFDRHPVETCSWVEPDLCSRCHGPRRPTRAQSREIARIHAFKGEVQVRHGGRPGELVVDLVARGRAGRPALLTLAPSGRVVERYLPTIEVEVEALA